MQQGVSLWWAHAERPQAVRMPDSVSQWGLLPEAIFLYSTQNSWQNYNLMPIWEGDLEEEQHDS